MQARRLLPIYWFTVHSRARSSNHVRRANDELEQAQDVDDFGGSTVYGRVALKSAVAILGGQLPHPPPPHPPALIYYGTRQLDSGPRPQLKTISGDKFLTGRNIEDTRAQIQVKCSTV
jgi:hypothetical protein